MIKKLLSFGPHTVFILALTCWTTAFYLGCTKQQLTQVQNASEKREVICNFVKAWAVDRPELKEIDQLCDAGADLKEIARAYGGCEETTER
jgi:hypothetical protein